jgi:hypothetical protein
MDTAFAVIIVLLILVIGGTLGYYIFDYRDYKVLATNNLTMEKVDREGTMQSVVDQVNSVNSNIYADLQNLNAGQTQMLSGLNNVFSLSSNTPVAPGPAKASSVSLLNFPGSANVDMNLLHHVNTTSGLTAAGLSSANPVKFCSEAGGHCIQLPNKDGDLYFTPMASSSKSSIIMDAPMTTVTGSLNLGDKGTFGPGPNNSMLLHSSSNIMIQSGSQNGVNVTNVGVEIIGNQNQPVAKITPTGTGIKIDAANVTLSGNLDVQGNIIAANFQPKINGQPTSAPIPPTTLPLGPYLKTCPHCQMVPNTNSPGANTLQCTCKQNNGILKNSTFPDPYVKCSSMVGSLTNDNGNLRCMTASH